MRMEEKIKARTLNASDWLQILRCSEWDDILRQTADQLRQEVYGKDVYLRGLIEYTNFCKNNCYYCGIRCGNTKAVRYRLSKEEILACCEEGYTLGFRTFVLQGGEDPASTDAWVCSMVSAIRERFPDCAVTLSIGEKKKSSYQAYYNAGARRYLLRHETANPEHYRHLHPAELSLENRKRCLYDLKEIGYQVGSGFMVGWFAWTDALASGGGLAVFAGLTAGYDWHRPLYCTERNAFCRTSQRNISINAATGVASADFVSVCVDSGNHCPWNNSPTGERVGLAGRCKCRHAKLVTRSGAKAVCFV